MTNEGLKPVLASEIEVRYALQPMGRDRELVQLLDVELIKLIELLTQKLNPEPLQFNHQVLRFGGEYVLRIKIQKSSSIEVFDVYLNASEAAFMVRFEGKNYSVISAKSICQIVAQLSLGLNIDHLTTAVTGMSPASAPKGSLPPQGKTPNNGVLLL